jgi:hypothetical protein
MLLLWGVIFFLRKSYISQLDSTDMLTNRKQNSTSSSVCCLIAGIRRCVIIMRCFQFNCVRVVIIIKPWRWLGQDAHVTVKWFYDATVKVNWKRYFGCADENRWELRKPTHFFIFFCLNSRLPPRWSGSLRLRKVHHSLNQRGNSKCMAEKSRRIPTIVQSMTWYRSILIQMAILTNRFLALFSQ